MYDVICLALLDLFCTHKNVAIAMFVIGGPSMAPHPGKSLRIFLERFQYHPADRVSNPRPLAVVCENPFSTAARSPEAEYHPADIVSNPRPLAVVCENPFSNTARTPECSILDIYAIELHKHVIKDCDKALQLEPSAIQAYLLKGSALLALGIKQEAVLVLEQGYKNALEHTSDLKQLLELDEA
ncbi:hypothetical protein Bca4012_081061 [Brassica carinata]